MIQFGNDKIKEIYVGSDKIKEVYHGADLVWSGEKNLVLFEKNKTNAGFEEGYVEGVGSSTIYRGEIEIWSSDGYLQQLQFIEPYDLTSFSGILIEYRISSINSSMVVAVGSKNTRFSKMTKYEIYDRSKVNKQILFDISLITGLNHIAIGGFNTSGSSFAVYLSSVILVQ